jgi:hypothetical protein
MATNFRGFGALGIVGFAALTVTAVSACSGNGIADGNPVTSPAAGAPAVTSSPATTNTVDDAKNVGGSVATPVAVSTSLNKCLPVNLHFALGNSSQRGQNQWAQAVDMTNHSSATCTMDGVPGVDLLGDTDSQQSYDWTLVASSANGAKVTLRPGATAHFDLVYLSGDLASGGADENVIAVHRMVITTPGQPDKGDATIQGSLDWAQSVVLQDAASHPGTYVMPVASGA